jgi:hypothetical protein
MNQPTAISLTHTRRQVRWLDQRLVIGPAWFHHKAIPLCRALPSTSMRLTHSTLLAHCNMAAAGLNSPIGVTARGTARIRTARSANGHHLNHFPFYDLISFFYLDGLDPPVCFPWDVIWNYRSYRQLVGLLGRMTSPVARPLPTQNTNKRNTGRRPCLEWDANPQYKC